MRTPLRRIKPNFSEVSPGDDFGRVPPIRKTNAPAAPCRRRLCHPAMLWPRLWLAPDSRRPARVLLRLRHPEKAEINLLSQQIDGSHLHVDDISRLVSLARAPRDDGALGWVKPEKIVAHLGHPYAAANVEILQFDHHAKLAHVHDHGLEAVAAFHFVAEKLELLQFNRFLLGIGGRPFRLRKVIRD